MTNAPIAPQSKKIKVTDLEKFVRQHIRNPFLGMCPESENLRLKNVIEYAKKYPEWWYLVISRISKINFYFPEYINHPTIDFLKERLYGH